MSTITTMTDDETPTASSPPSTPASGADATDGARPATRISRSASTRALSIPLPTAIVGALIAAMFGLLFFSLNGLRGDITALRNDIGTLRSDTNSQITELRSDAAGQITQFRNEFNSQITELRSEINLLRSDMDQRFAEVHAILLDHTDRLARIETHLDLSRNPATASP